MSDVFISYARSTAAQAKAAADALRAAGYSVWLDEDLPAHRPYAHEIEAQLKAAKAALVIWSAEAVLSEWVLSEANRAREDRKLVQAKVDDTRLPMPFDQIQFADLAGWSGGAGHAGWRKAVASIAELAAGPTSVAAAAPTPKAIAEPLLAVLAFDNLSGDPEMAYFSDGVSEEIQQTVARGTDLKVIGRNSSFQFRGVDKTARHVAAELNATHILDGSVRRGGPKVRISAQLVECASQTTLWSDRFDRDLSDVFALQDEIAGAVAAALKVALAPAAAPGAVDPAIHDLFLRARARATVFDAEQVVQTIRMVEQVVAAAPGFARAWSFLAALHAWLLRSHGEAARRYGITREAGRAAAETARRLDAGLGRAYAVLSLFEPWASFEKREALLRRALEVAPNDPTTLIVLARFANEVGRHREAADYARQSYDLDPLNLDAVIAYLEFCQPYDRDLWESMRERWPDSDIIALNAIGAAAGHGDWEGFDSFVAASRLRVTTDPTFRTLVWACRNLRDPDPQSIMRGFERARQEVSRTETLPLSTLCSLSELGMTEEVFGLIDQASFAHLFDESGPSPSGIFNPSLIFARSLVRDIRFVRLCAKLGLCSYWVKTERWPDCADEVGYDFKAEARRLADAA